MSFNRLLADAPPAKAAQAALVMARATVNEPGLSAETKQVAQQFIALGVDELTELIRARRVDAVTADLLTSLHDAEAESADVGEERSEDEGGEGTAMGATHEVQGVPQEPKESHRVRSYDPPWKYVVRGGRVTEIDREQTEAIREWARRNGHNVSTRGRIPADVVDGFIRANRRRS